MQTATVEHSAVLLTCIKLPHCFKTLFCIFLSGRLRQVSLYRGTQNSDQNVSLRLAKLFVI